MVQLFGRYRGTDPGARAALGQPVRAAAEGVGRGSATTRRRWPRSTTPTATRSRSPPSSSGRSSDTAKALYAVDDFPKFVAIQTETAVRHIASSYPYTSHADGELSLRDNADEITSRLSDEIADRVAAAGVTIIESRLTRLSYAPEIAQAMLRQQQANAVVGARTRIVEGAVGMVQLALQRLEDEDVVELDEERKAAMVSQPARGAVQRAGDPAGRQHRLPLPVRQARLPT